MTTQEYLQRYKDFKNTLEKYNYALFIMSYDEVTDCPKKDKKHSLEVQDYFQQKYTDILTSEEYKQTIAQLYARREELDEITRLDVEIEQKRQEKLSRIPKEELYRHFENLSRSGYEWAKAREDLCYEKFFVELKELVEYNKKYIRWQETEKLKGYNVLLDEMEEGYTEEMYDEFFSLVERELVPFVDKILKQPKPYNTKLDHLTFDISKQKKLTERIAKAMEYDNTVGCIRETIHPFTNWANNNDVRITTSYHEDQLFSNLYSVMHEIGHALFQIQMDEKYNGTNIFSNVTCITHESQSRFYENYLGRSRAFVSFLYPILKELFPEEFSDVTEEDVYGYVNCVKAQYIRVEADELTYPLHVLIRYNVEKKLFHNEITVEEIPATFDDYMEKYLHIRPKNLKEGAFQDSHWSSCFGYFPTYAVGSAYGTQFLESMKKDLDVDALLKVGDFKPVNAWLKERIHRYSGTRKNLEVVRAVCGEEFQPEKYISYLKQKFTEIYFA